MTVQKSTCLTFKNANPLVVLLPNDVDKKSQLINFYESRLQKVRAHWLAGKEDGSFQYERGQDYVKHAESELEAVKNGRNW
jgi:hypothetical protein